MAMDANADLKAKLPSRHLTEARAPYRLRYDALGLTKQGGGNIPRQVCTLTATEGIAMGHQAPRETMADSVELTMRGHPDDALVGLAAANKSLQGMMMAMCRLNVPAIFIYGESILPDTFKAHAVTVQDVFEAELDAAMELLTVRLSAEVLTNRKREWKPRSSEFTSGYLWKYAQQVGPARNGTATHPGGGAETSCDADI